MVKVFYLRGTDGVGHSARGVKRKCIIAVARRVGHIGGRGVAVNQGETSEPSPASTLPVSQAASQILPKPAFGDDKKRLPIITSGKNILLIKHSRLHL